MIKHLFKLIWNKKKQNFLLMTEILISFIVIFAAFTLILNYYHNYKKPMGLDYNEVWVINYSNTYKTANTDSLNLYYETLRQVIKSMPQVKELSFTGEYIPFTHNTTTKDIILNNRKIDNVNWFTAEDSYKDVLDMKLLDGRWFNKTDVIAKDQAVVINSDLKEILFGNDNAVGEVIGDFNSKNKMKVIGVVQSVKINGDYSPSKIGIYTRADITSFDLLSKILVKVTPDANAAFEGRLYKTLANYMKNADISLEHLSTKRTFINYIALIPMILLLIVSCFLIINVALGLFGVLWYNIYKRRGEIGLRMAVGATGKVVSGQLVTESLILATLSLIIGSVLVIQLPLLNAFNLPASIYLIALFGSILFIYLLVLICSFYPARQAAAIYPAVALHEE
jgi:putative ABC transport system permease protein